MQLPHGGESVKDAMAAVAQQVGKVGGQFSVMDQDHVHAGGAVPGHVPGYVEHL
ncbi:hypothetical protein [Streptomyces sp. CA-132043]|uniref:hypothetical protein n=1 Tax=Streptomyces sp. CA-132043 TaxID=3240048 RepID=UPI003D8F3A2B